MHAAHLRRQHEAHELRAKYVQDAKDAARWVACVLCGDYLPDHVKFVFVGNCLLCTRSSLYSSTSFFGCVCNAMLLLAPACFRLPHAGAQQYGANA